MAESQRETLRNLLVTEFAKIKTADGYRTDVELVLSYKPFSVENHPAIVVELVEEETVFEDTNRNVANTNVRIHVWGHFKDEMQGDAIPVYAAESAGEPLLHDMKKIVRTLMIRDVGASSSPRWQILDPIRVFGPDYNATGDGFVRIEFQARILYQGAAW